MPANLSINLINIILSEEKYRERFRFYLSLDSMITEQIIYVQNYTSNLSFTNNTTVKTAPQRFNSGIFFWIWVLGDIIKTLNSTKGTKWVIIEHLTGFVLFFIRIYRVILKVKPILVHGIYAEDHYYYLNRVWRKDGQEWIDENQDKYYLSRWRKRTFRQSLYIRSSDAIVTNSPRMVKYVRQKFKRPAFRVYNTISLTDSKDKVKKRDIDILFVGKITPAKGIAGMLQAISKIKGNYTIVLIGKILDQDREWAKRVFEAYSQMDIKVIDHLPWSDLKSMYLRSKIFILPSYSEGSPRVILEALSLNCIVLASNIPGNTFPMFKETNPIIYFESGNTISLQEILARLLKCHNQESNEASRFLDNFNIKNVQNDFINFINVLITNNTN